MREGGYVPKCTIAYSQRGRVNNFGFLHMYLTGPEFSSYEIELGSRVTQNDLPLRRENFYINFSFELLTRSFNFYFSTFKLLTRCLK